MTAIPKLLFVTDLAYKANARVYCDEDIALSSDLNQRFHVALCHPKSAAALLADFDVVIFRNTGPIMYFQKEYEAFRKAATVTKAKAFNQLTGKADMLGKQYLVDLFNDGFPVIPSIDMQHERHRLPDVSRYVVKLKNGADSIGMQFVPKAELSKVDLNQKLAQPMMDFTYEVSFYYINHDFHYALYAPNPAERWSLKPYDATAEDLEFARRFIEWNDIDFGIQRIDACRVPSGELLLMEIEDVNPYLSLDLVPNDTRQNFVQALSTALNQLASKESASS